MKPANIPITIDNNEYQDAFRKKIFSLIKLGYERLDKLSFRKSEEEDITGEIVREMIEVLKLRSAPKWARTISVHEDPRINTQGKLGKRRKKADIEFEYLIPQNRPRYAFEAKRLNKEGFSVGKYLGTSGLGEFLSGSYGANSNEAGMLGYIQSDDPNIWASKIEKHFYSDTDKIRVCNDGNWQNVKVTDDLPYCYKSKHNRILDSSQITIYHALLEFC